MAETSKETSKEKPEDMAFKNQAVGVIKQLVHENSKMRQAMTKASEQKKKTVRAESAASRIQGLRTIKNTLGTPTKPNKK